MFDQWRSDPHFAIKIWYSDVMAFNQYTFRMKIRSQDGTLLDTYEVVTQYISGVAVFDFPLIGPYTNAVVQQDPMPLVVLLRSSLLEGHKGLATSSSVANILGRFGTSEVVDALSEAMYCGLVTAENAKQSGLPRICRVNNPTPIACKVLRHLILKVTHLTSSAQALNYMR
jgi:hypothetical protein